MQRTIKVHRATVKRARRVTFPYRYHFLPQIYALVPHGLWAFLTRLLGVHRAMDSHTAAPPSEG